MTSTTPTPHDALFRGLLGKPEHARGVLYAIVPAEVATAIDWEPTGHFFVLGEGDQPRRAARQLSEADRGGSSYRRARP